jgi:hypothetical protein
MSSVLRHFTASGVVLSGDDHVLLIESAARYARTLG